MPTGFEALQLSPTLLSVLEALGHSDPTPIQTACIPPLLAGRDIIGQSKTGSGKTAAFGLPILEKVDLQNQLIQALILCPTRELATQVAQELRKLGRRHAGLQVRTISGGEPIREQTLALKRGVHIIVGTPGRVLDHLERGTLTLGGVKTLVLDEADRMLEMGFQAAIFEVVAATPAERQTVCFSATYPNSIEEMSRQVQRKAQRVTIQESADTPAARQLQMAAEPEEKMDALRWALSSLSFESALVFCNTKAKVAEIADRLHLDGVSVDCLHGDLEQYERDKVMAQFKNQSIRVLVATDVAARGIDVAELDLVINFELAHKQEVHLHRIGRTGRAGKEGLALSMVSHRDGAKFSELVGPARIELTHWSPKVDRSVLMRAPRMQTIHIAGGRKDKVRPGDILGALTGEAGGLSGADIGKIDIFDSFAYVAVALRLSSEAVRSLGNGKIKGRRFKVSLLK